LQEFLLLIALKNHKDPKQISWILRHLFSSKHDFHPAESLVNQRKDPNTEDMLNRFFISRFAWTLCFSYGTQKMEGQSI